MKSNSSIRTLLGISQADLAHLLKVHRSQLAMFETGKRDLPREAKLLLAPMLEQAANATQKKTPEEKRFDLEKQEYLEELLNENEFQRLQMDRRLHYIRSSNEKHVGILKLTSHMEKSAKFCDEHYTGLIQSIRYKAEYGLSKYSPVQVLKYEIKAEMLELEKLLLQELIQKYTHVKASQKKEVLR